MLLKTLNSLEITYFILIITQDNTLSNDVILSSFEEEAKTQRKALLLLAYYPWSFTCKDKDI